MFCSELLPTSAIQYFLMGVLLVMSKNPGENPTLGRSGIRALQMCAESFCLLEWLPPRFWLKCFSILGFRTVSVGDFSGLVIVKTGHWAKL